MKDAKKELRTNLLAHAPLVAIVPASRIFVDWPTTFNALPCISYREINNFVRDEDIADNRPLTEVSEVEVQIFDALNKSTTPTAQAVDDALVNAGWNRDYSADLALPEQTVNRKVMRYNRLL